MGWLNRLRYPPVVLTIRHVLNRLLGRAGLCLAATFLAYLLASLVFDPLAALRTHQPPPSAEVLDTLSVRLGLDQPIVQRFVLWITRIPLGNFGETVSGLPISGEVMRRAGTSLRLFVGGGLVAIFFGVVLGCAAALRAGGLFDQLSSVAAMIALAIPVFALGTLLKTGWLPVNIAAGEQLLYFSGETLVGAASDGIEGLVDRLRHLVLPTLAIAIPQIAYFSRYQRAALLDVINAGYVNAARSRGLTRTAAVFRHGLRPALVPVLSLFAFSFGLHLIGGVFTERVFGWHGMGDWLLTGVVEQDANVIATVTLFIAVIVVCAGLVSDILLLVLDPRLRVSS